MLATVVTQSGVDFMKFSLYVLRFGWLLGQWKMCHFVRVHSTNLFGCRNATLGLVCVVVCITAYCPNIKYK